MEVIECPNCGSSDLEYTPDPDNLLAPGMLECNNCGCTFSDHSDDDEEEPVEY
jgi:transcription initiation factor TFIIIB Brf1 subunit/transcription initiation factor TFIIB